jgi:hypothetical protein
MDPNTKQRHGKLENEFKKLVRNKVVILEPQKIDLLRNVYSDFFNQLCAVTRR